jgi:hypothetical protein
MRQLCSLELGDHPLLIARLNFRVVSVATRGGRNEFRTFANFNLLVMDL